MVRKKNNILFKHLLGKFLFIGDIESNFHAESVFKRK